MQKLHPVGFTPDLDGLILSTRKGAKSGSYVVAVDASLLKQLAEANHAAAPVPRANGVRPSHAPRQSSPDSLLTPREMQELLRGGWSLEEVAVEAGVDVDWVERFAAPVRAEMRKVLDQARDLVFDKPRVGTSALPLAPSVRRNVAERGVRFTDEEFEDAWRAAQLDDLVWLVGFDYQSRGREQSAEWIVDLETGDVTSHNRLGTQLGHVQSARRRVDTSPPPKPKPKAAAARAMAREKTDPPPPPPKTAARVPATAPSRARSRASSTSAKRASGAKSRSKSSKPHAEPVAAVAPPAPPPRRPEGPKRDPWREELRRRELERSAALTARAQEATPEPEPEPEPAELAPVAIIGPTVRTLRRPQPRPTPTEPAASELPHTIGPLPAPAPIAVPDEIREKASHPIGQVVGVEPEPEPEPEPVAPAPAPAPVPRPAPSRATFKGARAAAPASTAAPAPTRRRRSEPLRAR
jgi:hypothetical protein